MAKVALAMSGGVDSSVSAMLLQDQGHEVIGVTFKLNDLSDAPETDAGKVCEFLGIHHRVLDFRKDFDRIVVQPFIDSYMGGTTPNPCVVCNKGIKFGKFLDYALEIGCDYVATGHYGGVGLVEGRYCLKVADDISKDQTYALYRLDQKQLSHIMMPLGGMSKPQVRQLARDRGLPMAERPDSQDICFIPDGDHGSFIERNTDTAGLAGSFVHEGKEVGTHKGIYRYTIGQRKGLGLSLGKPAFIKAIHSQNKEIEVTTQEEEIFYNSLLATEPVFSMVEALEGSLRVQAKIRYSHKPCQAVASMEGELLRVRFDLPQRAITPGQSVVLYKDGHVFGGGFILRGEA